MVVEKPIDYKQNRNDFLAGYYFKLYFNKNNFIGKPYYRFDSFVEYEILQKGVYIKKYREIPYKIKLTVPFPYTVFEAVEENFFEPSSIGFTKGEITEYSYPMASILYTFLLLKGDGLKSDVRIKRAFTVVYTCDAFFYEKYIIPTKYEERMSARFDIKSISPTNFQSFSETTHGILGAITVDTVDIPIDTNIISKFNYPIK